MDFDKLYKNNPEMYGNKPSAWIIKIFRYLPDAKRVLDLGICYGRNAIYLAKKRCEVEGVDISKVAIDQCLEKAKKNKVNIKLFHQDINDFVFKGKYDVIFSTMTLQYLENEEVAEKIIKKMKLHTQTDGLNVLSVPTTTKIAMKMPFYFDKQKLINYYKNWEILEFKEQEDLFSNGKIGTIAFIIAKKK